MHVRLDGGVWACEPCVRVRLIRCARVGGGVEGAEIEDVRQAG